MSALLDTLLDDQRRIDGLAAFDRLSAEATPAPRPRPNHPPLLAAWLALEFRRGAMTPAMLLREAQAMAVELSHLKGYGLESQEGAEQVRLPLGDASVVVEYEWSDHEPESGLFGEPCLLGVHINGVWVEPDFVADESTRDGWIKEITRNAQGERHDLG